MFFLFEATFPPSLTNIAFGRKLCKHAISAKCSFCVAQMWTHKQHTCEAPILQSSLLNIVSTKLGFTSTALKPFMSIVFVQDCKPLQAYKTTQTDVGYKKCCFLCVIVVIGSSSQRIFFQNLPLLRSTFTTIFWNVSEWFSSLSTRSLRVKTVCKRGEGVTIVGKASQTQKPRQRSLPTCHGTIVVHPLSQVIINCAHRRADLDL